MAGTCDEQCAGSVAPSDETAGAAAGKQPTERRICNFQEVK